MILEFLLRKKPETTGYVSFMKKREPTYPGIPLLLHPYIPSLHPAPQALKRCVKLSCVYDRYVIVLSGFDRFEI